VISMKMLLMNYYVGIDQEVKEIIEAAGVCTYTRLAETEGRISCGEPRENSHVWPGSNSTLFAVVDDGTADMLVRRIEEFNVSVHGEGIDAYVMNVERSVSAKA
jgi:hypothetical protein